MSKKVIDLATYYTKKSDIVDNLTTDDSAKILSAKQGKKLQDDKVNKNQGIANANMNVITDTSGNITVGELNESSSFVDTLAKLYSKDTEHTINQTSINDGYGGYHFDSLYITEDDVYVSCLFKQTDIDNGYIGGLVVAADGAFGAAGEVDNDKILYAATTGNFGPIIEANTENNAEIMHVTQSLTTCPFGGVNGIEDDNYITFGTWYKFEVYKTGTKYTTTITNTNTGNVVLSQSIENGGNFKYWGMYAHEGCVYTYKNVVINKIAINSFFSDILTSTHNSDSTAHADIRQKITHLEEEISEYYEDMAG